MRAGFSVAVVLDTLRVTAGWALISIQAQFHPLNARSPRGTRVDFTGSSAAEHQGMFAETLNGFLKR